MTTLDELTKKRPIREEVVQRHMARMRAEVRAYRLKELREQMHVTQNELATQLHVSQNRVSTIERGEIERVQLDTLRRYVEALGGSLHVEVKLGSQKFSLT